MKGKKSPLNFADEAPAPSEPALPPFPAAEESTLAMPALPEDMNLTTLSPSLRGPRAKPAADGRQVYWLAAVASALWAGGMVGLVLAYQQRLGFFDFEPIALTIFGLLALAPIGLIWLGVYAIRQASGFVAKSRRSQDYAERMLEPAAYAAAETGSVVASIHGQIDRAVTVAMDARTQMMALRDLLAEEAEQLVKSAGVSTQTARALVEGLGRERQELAALSQSLDGQAEAISQAITRQARMVAEASDLAQTQIAEAEAALAARAADLATAANEAGSVTRIASEDIARQAARLEAAGATVSEQVQIVEETLGQQRAALVTAAHDLRVDQEDVAVQVEAQRAQLAEILAQSVESATQLNGVAAESANALRQLTTEAAEQVRDVAQSAQEERDLLGATALKSLGAFSEAAAFERRALEEETRHAIDALQSAAEAIHRNAETSGEAARQKIEQLSEAAFAAGQKADAAYDSRLNEARGLIERTAQLVDEAGQRSVERLDTSVGAARNALTDLENGLAAIEARSARLPEEAQARADEVKAALEAATQSLLATAHQAAEETQAIDAAFQERVKRNYEMLSEAVRLMGVIGGGASARASGQTAPVRPPRPVAPSLAAPAATPGEDEPSSPRLKLTPVPTDEDGKPAQTEADASELFAPIDPPSSLRETAPRERSDEWTWTDLLGAVDDETAPDVADNQISLADALIAEIEAIGLDPASLLPRSRIDEVIAALDAGNRTGGRDSVRRLAPAAIRRLSRRVLSDKMLRSQAERFIASYQSLLREAEMPGAEVSRHALLGSPAGRAYLLLDAAVGDLS